MKSIRNLLLTAFLIPVTLRAQSTAPTGTVANGLAPEVTDLNAADVSYQLEAKLPDLEKPYLSFSPSNRNDGIPVAAFSARFGDRDAILKFASEVAAGDHGEIDSFLLMRDGKLIFESYYRRGRVNYPHYLESVRETAKVFSMVSTAEKALSNYQLAIDAKKAPRASPEREGRWERAMDLIRVEWDILKGLAGAGGGALGPDVEGPHRVRAMIGRPITAAAIGCGRIEAIADGGILFGRFRLRLRESPAPEGGQERTPEYPMPGGWGKRVPPSS